MGKNLRLEGLTEAYYDMRGLIRNTVWDFMRTHSIHLNQFPELEGQANLLFVEAYDSYDPDRNIKLSTHVVNKILRGLLDFKKRKGYQSVLNQVMSVLNTGSVGSRRVKDNDRSKQHLKRNRLEMERKLSRPVSNYYPNLEWLMKLMEDDSRQIMVLIMNPPDELSQLEQDRMKEERLAKYLRGTLGWSENRVQRAFREMRGAIG